MLLLFFNQGEGSTPEPPIPPAPSVPSGHGGGGSRGGLTRGEVWRPKKRKKKFKEIVQELLSEKPQVSIEPVPEETPYQAIFPVVYREAPEKREVFNPYPALPDRKRIDAEDERKRAKKRRENAARIASEFKRLSEERRREAEMDEEDDALLLFMMEDE